jgi:hypothetical protein
MARYRAHLPPARRCHSKAGILCVGAQRRGTGEFRYDLVEAMRPA